MCQLAHVGDLPWKVGNDVRCRGLGTNRMSQVEHRLGLRLPKAAVEPLRGTPWLEEDYTVRRAEAKERKNLYPMDFYAKEGLGRTTIDHVKAAEVPVGA